MDEAGENNLPAAALLTSNLGAWKSISLRNQLVFESFCEPEKEEGAPDLKLGDQNVDTWFRNFRRQEVCFVS